MFQTSIDWIKLQIQSSVDPGLHYDLRGDTVLLRTSDGRPTMNFGYWRGLSPRAPDALGRATAALFHLIGESAELSPADAQVLDVGCGFGTNAIYCVKTFAPRHMVGLNLSEFQLKKCRELVTAAGLADRIRFERGSATRLPFPEGHFAKVVSVEAAFHFDLRADFFREAYRVLAPGGILAMSDLLGRPPAGPLTKLHLALLRHSFQIPAGNIYGLEVYRAQLEAAGFEVLQLESIKRDVMLPYERWLLTQPLWKILSINPVFLMGSSTFFLYPWDYLLVKARKREKGAQAMAQAGRS